MILTSFPTLGYNLVDVCCESQTCVHIDAEERVVSNQRCGLTVCIKAWVKFGICFRSRKDHGLFLPFIHTHLPFLSSSHDLIDFTVHENTVASFDLPVMHPCSSVVAEVGSGVGIKINIDVVYED